MHCIFYCIDLVRFNKWIKQSLTNKLLDYTGGCNKQRSNVGNGNSTVIKDEFACLSIIFLVLVGQIINPKTWFILKANHHHQVLLILAKAKNNFYEAIWHHVKTPD